MSEAQEVQVMEQLPAPSNEYIAQAEARSLEFMNPKRWQVMNVMAQTFINSGALPSSIKNAAQLIMVFQAGYEAGMQPLEAISAYYIVNGKITLYGQMAITQVIRAGHQVTFTDCTDESATCTITRGDTKQSFTQTYTMKMARERGLPNGKDVWAKFPENMLRFKAFNLVANFLVPDALHGIPIKEDIEDSESDAAAEPQSSHADPKIAAIKTARKPSLAEALEDKPETTESVAKDSEPQSTTETTPEEQSSPVDRLQEAERAIAFIKDKYLTLNLNQRGQQWLLKKTINKPFAKIFELKGEEAIKVADTLTNLLDGVEEIPDNYVADVDHAA